MKYYYETDYIIITFPLLCNYTRILTRCSSPNEPKPHEKLIVQGDPCSCLPLSYTHSKIQTLSTSSSSFFFLSTPIKHHHLVSFYTNDSFFLYLLYSILFNLYQFLLKDLVYLYGLSYTYRLFGFLSQELLFSNFIKSVYFLEVT